MNPIQSLEANFKPSSPLGVEFKALRKKVFLSIEQRNSRAAREALIVCCDFCIEHQLSEFDPELEGMSALCTTLEAQLEGRLADQQALIIEIQTVIEDTFTKDEIVEMCMEKLQAGDLPGAVGLRHIIPDNHPAVAELDETIKTCRLMGKAFLDNPTDIQEIVDAVQSDQIGDVASKLKHFG